MNQQKTGAFLRELRLGKSLTQEQLAEALGVSNRSVSRWENGNNMPDLDLLLELSRLYGVGVDEILDGKRKENRMDEMTNETAEKVAEYASEEKKRLTKILRVLLILALIMSATAIFLNYFEIEGRLASFLKGFSGGVNFAMIVVALIFTSRYGTKLRAAKLNMLNKIKNKQVNK